MKAIHAVILASLLLFACSQDEVNKKEKGQVIPDMNSTQILSDPHSFARPSEASLTHLDLDVKVDFEEKRISGTATWTLNNQGTDRVFLDTRELDIQKVTDLEGKELKFKMGEKEAFLGQGLEVEIDLETTQIVVHYSTRPGADALQWLDPVQTSGKKEPFLFTQSQAILARTWIPCQDGPGMRFTYKAKVQVPANLMAVMSASNPTKKDKSGAYEFEMKQPIPAYLMALSVGDLVFKPIGKRTGVYAEPSMLDASVYEFADMEKMLIAAEDLYGPYSWDRYDVIVLPPSFPFGGMENPRLTFATPTILAGDRSLTALIAHELAHSWSGNLVTNATWDDFWLNEGFTVYFERRIMEKLFGASYAEMLSELGYQDLQATLEELGQGNPDTQLKLNLTGRDPDEGMTDIAYEKGNFLLLHIEEVVGRQKWDAFLRQYFEANAFKVMTTEGFVEIVNRDLIKMDKELSEKINLNEWIYKPGLPAGVKAPRSGRFEAVNGAVKAWEDGEAAGNLSTSEWTTHEWLYFLRSLPTEMSKAQMTGLDKAFNFTGSGNSEIQAEWYRSAIRNEYKAANKAIEDFLMKVGRRKFLKPLYKEMAATDSGLKWARKIYKKARPNYHSVSTGTIDELLGL